MKESYTVEEASEKALGWCAIHPGWKRICDVSDSAALYKTWSELPKRVRASWEKAYRSNPEEAWLEWGDKPCKVPFGFISGAGKFYKSVLDVPQFHNSMMVFKVA